MAYPASLDTFLGTATQGTSLLTSPDHALDHRTLGSAAGSIEGVLGTTAGTSVLKNFVAGNFAARTNNETFGTPTLTLGSDVQGDMFYRSAGGTATRLPIGTNGQFLTTNGTTPSWGASTSATDGWISTADAFVYVSANSFKISGVDKTAVYTKGTRIKFTNNSTTFYGVVASSSFSVDTTVTCAPNSDYSIANSAITAPSYSYEVSPQGYPGWFNYTPSYTGFSANPAQAARFAILGNMAMISIDGGSAGTSNATTTTFTGPTTPSVSRANAGAVFVQDNGALQSTPGHIQTTAATAAISVYKTFFQGGWTGSGNKNFWTSLVTYEF